MARSELIIGVYSAIGVNALYCVLGVQGSYTPNSLKTILGAFSCVYRYVMDV